MRRAEGSVEQTLVELVPGAAVGGRAAAKELGEHGHGGRRGTRDASNAKTSSWGWLRGHHGGVWDTQGFSCPRGLGGEKPRRFQRK